MIQNAIARVQMELKRRPYITPGLMELHWLLFDLMLRSSPPGKFVRTRWKVVFTT